MWTARTYKRKKKKNEKTVSRSRHGNKKECYYYCLFECAILHSCSRLIAYVCLGNSWIPSGFYDHLKSSMHASVIPKTVFSTRTTISARKRFLFISITNNHTARRWRELHDLVLLVRYIMSASTHPTARKTIYINFQRKSICSQKWFFTVWSLLGRIQ